MSTPRSAAASTLFGTAEEPDHPIVPADDTAGASVPSLVSNAARSRPSAMGERQTLPVHTTRIDAMVGRESTRAHAAPGPAFRPFEAAPRARRLRRPPQHE